MTRSTVRIFDHIRADAGAQLTRPYARCQFAAWAEREPALAGMEPADLLGRMGPGGSRLANDRLGPLLRLGAVEPLAHELLLGALSGGLAAVATRLACSWRADREEVDQAVAAAAWSRIRLLAGRTIDWPATAILDAVRGEVRAGLAAAARRSRMPLADRLPSAAAGPEDEAVGALAVLTYAVRRGAVSADAAGVVYATRVLGFRLGDLAGPGRSEGTLRVQRWRAERTLRSVA